MKQLTKGRIKFEFVLENRLAERYKETFVAIVMALPVSEHQKSIEGYCDIVTQEYKVEKCDIV